MPDTIEVRELKTKKDIKLFATFPLKLYKGCPYYVPSLRSDEMNTFNPKKNFSAAKNKAKGFLCYKNGELVGRILGIVNYKENQLYGKNYVRFSRIECIDDIEVFKTLLGAVEKFGKENGMDIIHGPWGFNDTDREGMLYYGFNERSTYATNYYYPYFAENLRKLGFSDESKWLERRFTIPEKNDERIMRIGSKVMKKYNLTEMADKMPMSKLAKLYADEFFDTVNDAYKVLDGYVPVEGDAKYNVLKQFATIINPRYFSMILDEKGKVAALGVVLPSICEPLKKHKGKLFPTGFIGVLHSIKKPKDLEMALIAVRSEYKNKGLNACVISRILGNIVEDNIENLESNPMLEHNFNIQMQWKFTQNEVIKKRQTFQKEIGSLIKD